ncbi:unnamed protein product, partial [Didymodactylos carnosus]
KLVASDQESSNDSFGNSKAQSRSYSHSHRVLRQRVKRQAYHTDHYFDDDLGLSMYDRVKRRRKADHRSSITSDEDLDRDDDEEQEQEDEVQEQDDDENKEPALSRKSRYKESENNSAATLGQSELEADVTKTGDEDESEEENEQQDGPRKYSLRQRKPPPQHYAYIYDKPRRKIQKTIFFRDQQQPSKSKSQIMSRRLSRRRRRVSAHGSSSDDSSSTTDSETGPITAGDLTCRPEQRMRKAKSTAINRMKCLPTNIDLLSVLTSSTKNRNIGGTGNNIGDRHASRTGGASLADVEAMEIDRSITFDDIGGLDHVIRSLKEMIVLPLMYPELFQHYKIRPPRGVLFYGPPGTGKTLVARALVNECSGPNRRIAFFMRKGADCLCKWVGESERQLRVLFDQAYQMRPSIIFFDEIDGLAPVRSARQDQIHASIVSTLLALMDGLDSRGEIVVIGATNRLDAIDPALRRPGRFDREFRFSLPTYEARKHILKIHTKDWESKPHENFINEIANRTASYCGADLKGLCQEAFLSALRRRYPQIYDSRQKLKVNPRSLNLSRGDFYSALHQIVPACNRSNMHPVGRSLDIHLIPLLSEQLDSCMKLLEDIFFKRSTNANSGKLSNKIPFESITEDRINNPSTSSSLPVSTLSSTMGFHSASYAASLHRSATFTILSAPSNGLCRFFTPAVVQQLDCAFYVFELGYLHGQNSRTPEEACAQLFAEARRSSPAVIYVPDIENLWPKLSDSVQYMFISNVRTLPSNLPILVLMSAETFSIDDLDKDLQQLISPKSTFSLSLPSENDRRAFFAPLFCEDMYLIQTTNFLPQDQSYEELELEEPTQPLIPDERELQRIRQREEATMCELRVFLRDILKLLARDKKFTYFSRPVDPELVPDYFDIVKEPMDFTTLYEKIDTHGYTNVKQFEQDIDLIVTNALLYNPNNTNQGRMIRHRACELRDYCQYYINAELDLDFEALCQQITESRKQRGDDPRASLPDYVFTEPVDRHTEDNTHDHSSNHSKLMDSTSPATIMKTSSMKDGRDDLMDSTSAHISSSSSPSKTTPFIISIPNIKINGPTPFLFSTTETNSTKSDHLRVESSSTAFIDLQLSNNTSLTYKPVVSLRTNKKRRSGDNRRSKMKKQKNEEKQHNTETVLPVEDAANSSGIQEDSSSNNLEQLRSSSSMSLGIDNSVVNGHHSSQSSSSSPIEPPLQQLPSTRSKRSISISPSKLNAVKLNETADEHSKTKRRRTESNTRPLISITTNHHVELNSIDSDIEIRKILHEPLSLNLNYLVSHTNGFGIERLSSIWFDVYDYIESFRSQLPLNQNKKDFTLHMFEKLAHIIEELCLNAQ